MMIDRQARTVTTADGVALAVEIHGRRDMAPHVPTVVLAHDWGLTRECWGRVVERVIPWGVRVLTWDQRGHGRSTLGLDRDLLDDLTIDHFGRDLQAVIRAIVPPTSPVILVGHSLGGMTAMSYVGQHLKEARTRVAGAVLLSAAAVDVRLGQAPRGRLGKLLGRTGPDPYEVPLRASNVHDLFGDDPEPSAVEAVREQLAGTDAAVLRAAYRAFCQADVRRAFELLAVLPVSILGGAKDRVTPSTRSRAMTITLTEARFTALSGVGHALPYEAPDRIVDELRWVLETLRENMRSRASQRAASPGAPQSRSGESS